MLVPHEISWTKRNDGRSSHAMTQPAGGANQRRADYSGGERRCPWGTPAGAGALGIIQTAP